MIEALACGTPVIAWRSGPVPEVIDEGRTGFMVESVEEAVEAVARIAEINRETCREVFENRFEAAGMARNWHLSPDRFSPQRSTKGSKKHFVTFVPFCG